MSRSLRTLLVHKLAGAVLLVAGLAKLTGDGAETPLTAVPPLFFGAAPVLEILLAAWLLSGRCRVGVHAVTLVTFIAFSVVTWTQIQAGRSDCGCFGAAKVPPWATFVLDLVLVTLLTFTPPRWAGWPERSSGNTLVAVAGGTVAVGLLGAVGFAYLWHGSIAAALSAAAGEPIAVVNARIDLGVVRPGEALPATLQVTNLTDDEIQIAYVPMPCRCASFPDLPVTVPPRGTAHIAVTFLTPAKAGPFRRKGDVHSSAGDAAFEIVGEVAGDVAAD